MLKDNLIMLRYKHGFSQEDVAARINITRQAYAKWEHGQSVPDVDKCADLARLYQVTLDSLVSDNDVAGISVPPGPPGKNIWGTVTMDERGQIAIPRAAMQHLSLRGGQRFVVLSADHEGLALMPAEWFEKRMQAIIEFASQDADGEE